MHFKHSKLAAASFAEASKQRIVFELSTRSLLLSQTHKHFWLRAHHVPWLSSSSCGCRYNSSATSDDNSDDDDAKQSTLESEVEYRRKILVLPYKNAILARLGSGQPDEQTPAHTLNDIRFVCQSGPERRAFSYHRRRWHTQAGQPVKSSVVR